ncbi:MAG: poly(3-hydroxyalkanoate) synthetase [Deltaproteobacteria bacterium HGW-Deltaproteobacteria-1]|jgi:pimeloyl-ACP methyl ester carboxylesterase|nr:MAG: poly(3-hydroxyalkanoate) synthetase [Deltaproteobacteria bacterium HGW-Deltaproteobacteria-1]
MSQENNYLTNLNLNPLFRDMYDYLLDSGQRSILFMDVMRRRGNNYFQTIKKGEPPVLIFDYEILLSGRTLKRPVNYDLARIIPPKDNSINPNSRPIIVIDPRAGNGPGIGGSKRESEIGDALAQGHPVYFILFHPEPVFGQTIADVEQAEILFIEEVSRRHPKAPKPAVIGNCQAGWAVAMLGADRPDMTGPLVLNGAPLSYWAGVQGKNPMRYGGGLLGGIWMVSLMADLGHGNFDGAWLEENFESLNPGNTLWTKQYNLYANVDTDEERYLTFEKWWDGYSDLSKEEMHFIVENLFVGDKLEEGKLTLDRKKIINLKDIKKPLLLFASEGDNITPPQQALDWIIKEYGSTKEIKRQGKVIIYMIHPNVGHLGIFVGSKIAQKEHNEIIKSIDIIDALQPGLYEMIIVDKGKKEGVSDYDVRFDARDIKDLIALNDGKQEMKEEDADFRRVAAVSEINDRLYNTYVSPWVKMFSTETSADILKQLHPLRINKYIFSDTVNPFMPIFKTLAPLVKKNRSPVSPDNLFLSIEKNVSDSIVTILNSYQKARDQFNEAMFFAIYENPWMKMLYPEASQKKKPFNEQEKKEGVQIQKVSSHVKSSKRSTGKDK